jgi:hypothetical protein
MRKVRRSDRRKATRASCHILLAQVWKRRMGGRKSTWGASAAPEGSDGEVLMARRTVAELEAEIERQIKRADLLDKALVERTAERDDLASALRSAIRLAAEGDLT